MKTKIWPTSILLLGIFIHLTAYAADFRPLEEFETTEEGITQRLTAPPSAPTFKPLSEDSQTLVKVPVMMIQNDAVVESVEPVDPAKPTRRVNLKVEFDVNSAAIRKSSHAILDVLARSLRMPELADAQFVIKGHTDSDGNAAYNLKLSVKRAVSVKAYLVRDWKIDSDRLVVKGYGEALAIAPNDTPANKQLNRRVTIERIATEPRFQKMNQPSVGGTFD